MAIQVEGLASSQGIALTSLNVSAAGSSASTSTSSASNSTSSSVSGSVKTVLANIGATGSYEQIKQYIESLQTINRLVSFDQVTFNGLDQTGRVSAQITLKAYYLPASAGGVK